MNADPRDANPYGARSIRRTKAQIEAVKEALYEITSSISPATVRQVFYQAVSRGIVAKPEQWAS